MLVQLVIKNIQNNQGGNWSGSLNTLQDGLLVIAL
jgi:hypothetical protein